MVSTVETVGINDPVDLQNQRKTFYANGYFWVFYCDGNNLLYKTSSDGVTWSAATIVRACSAGEYFDVGYFPDYSTSYVYYAYAGGGSLIYRRGTISGNSITWEAEVTIYTLTWFNPAIAILSDGRIIVGANLLSGTTFYAYAWTNPNNDGSGSWSYTYMGRTGSDPFKFSAVPLTAGKGYLLYIVSTTLYGRLYSGSWYAEDNITTVSSSSNHYSATAEDDEVHVAYYSAATSYTKAYRKRSSGGVWGSEETIYTMSADHYGDTITIDPVTGDIYVFWGEGSAIYYCKKSGGTWGARVQLVSGELYLREISINAFYRVWNNSIGVVWSRGLAPSVYVRYEVLSLAVPVKHVFGDGLTWMVF
jgi:hypothetical protein